MRVAGTASRKIDRNVNLRIFTTHGLSPSIYMIGSDYIFPYGESFWKLPPCFSHLLDHVIRCQCSDLKFNGHQIVILFFVEYVPYCSGCSSF